MAGRIVNIANRVNAMRYLILKVMFVILVLVAFYWFFSAIFLVKAIAYVKLLENLLVFLFAFFLAFADYFHSTEQSLNLPASSSPASEASSAAPSSTIEEIQQLSLPLSSEKAAPESPSKVPQKPKGDSKTNTQVPHAQFGWGVVAVLSAATASFMHQIRDDEAKADAQAALEYAAALKQKASNKENAVKEILSEVRLNKKEEEAVKEIEQRIKEFESECDVSEKRTGKPDRPDVDEVSSIHIYRESVCSEGLLRLYALRGAAELLVSIQASYQAINSAKESVIEISKETKRVSEEAKNISNATALIKVELEGSGGDLQSFQPDRLGLLGRVKDTTRKLDNLNGLFQVSSTQINSLYGTIFNLSKTLGAPADPSKQMSATGLFLTLDQFNKHIGNIGSNSDSEDIGSLFGRLSRIDGVIGSKTGAIRSGDSLLDRINALEIYIGERLPIGSPKSPDLIDKFKLATNNMVSAAIKGAIMTCSNCLTNGPNPFGNPPGEGIDGGEAADGGTVGR